MSDLRLICRGREVTVPAATVVLLQGPAPPDGFEFNGAGPERLGPGRLGRFLARLITALVPQHVAEIDISVPAAWHDHHYSLGTTWADRRRADFRFGLNIIILAGAGGSLSLPRLAAIACIFWLGVRFGGWGAFSYATEERPLTRWHRFRERFLLFRRRRGCCARDAEPSRSWVAELLEAFHRREEEIAARYRRKQQELEEAARPKPKPKPHPAPAVITNRRRMRRVTIVGINRYDGRNDLRGCVTDALRWQALYLAGGWSVRLLLDREATADAIMESLYGHARASEPGDEQGLVISSHGTNIPDPADPTGQVEGVCPTDCMDTANPLDFADKVITHREVGDVVAILPPQVPFHAIADACHTGIPRESLEALLHRDLGAAAAEYRRARYLEAPILAIPPPTGTLAFGPMTRELVRLNGLRSLILSGCRTNQTSADARIAGEFCGAFSAHMQQAWAKSGWRSVEDLLAEACRTLKADGFDQVPVGHGDPERLAGPVPWAAK